MELSGFSGMVCIVFATPEKSIFKEIKRIHLGIKIALQ